MVKISYFNEKELTLLDKVFEDLKEIKSHSIHKTWKTTKNYYRDRHRINPCLLITGVIHEITVQELLEYFDKIPHLWIKIDLENKGIVITEGL